MAKFKVERGILVIDWEGEIPSSDSVVAVGPDGEPSTLRFVEDDDGGLIDSNGEFSPFGHWECDRKYL